MADEGTKLDPLRHTQGTDTALGTLGTKNPPVDADLVVQRNSAGAWALFTATWTQVKAYLKLYWDTLYDAIGAAAAAVATHAGLTTGVHGVGANYVAKSSVAALDLAAHKSRHQFLGADQLDIWALIVNQYTSTLRKNWFDLNGFTVGHLGTGSDPAISLGCLFLLLATGATAGGRSYVYGQSLWLTYGRICADLAAASANLSNSTVWFGWVKTPTNPSLFQVHNAFIVMNGALYASCGNGISFTQAELGITMTQYVAHTLFMVPTTAPSIAFYVDGVLKATISTTTYMGDFVYPTCHIVNGSDVDQQLRLYSVSY